MTEHEPLPPSARNLARMSRKPRELAHEARHIMCDEHDDTPRAREICLAFTCYLDQETYVGRSGEREKREIT